MGGLASTGRAKTGARRLEVNVAEKKKGFWASLAPDPDVLASGLVDNTTTMKIYKDGTFTTNGYWSGAGARDRLIAFDHDVDSMRRKSTTGRGAAALMTGGASLLASNNRGVVYVTVTGDESGVRTYTTRNPSGTTLSSIRRLKAAADVVLAQANSTSNDAAVPVDVATQLKQLVDLHATGALSDTEFAAAKARILGA